MKKGSNSNFRCFELDYRVLDLLLVVDLWCYAEENY